VVAPPGLKVGRNEMLGSWSTSDKGPALHRAIIESRLGYMEASYLG
jgi:hypothetical protein